MSSLIATAPDAADLLDASAIVLIAEAQRLAALLHAKGYPAATATLRLSDRGIIEVWLDSVSSSAVSEGPAIFRHRHRYGDSEVYSWDIFRGNTLAAAIAAAEAAIAAVPDVEAAHAALAQWFTP